MVNHDKPKVYQFELNSFNNGSYYTWNKLQSNQFIILNYKEFNKAALKTKAGVIYNNAYYKKGYPSLTNKEYDGNKKGIGKTLHIVENTFKELSYHFKWTILNTKEYGIPQNRERIYIVGFRDIKHHEKFEFRKPIELKLRLIDMLEDDVDEKYLLDERLVEEYKKTGTASKFKGSQAGQVIDANERDSSQTIIAGSHGYSIGFVKYSKKSKTKFYPIETCVDNMPLFNVKEIHLNLIPQLRLSPYWFRHEEVKTAKSFAQRGRYCKSMRQVGRRLNENGVREDYNYDINTKQQLEFRTDDIANYITCVQKDSMVAIKNAPIKMVQTHTFNIKGNEAIKRIYDSDGVGPALTTMGGGHREPKVAIRNQYGDFDIFRKYIPRECFRLQGFDDNFKFDVSDTQAYKQAGNSMSANLTDGILDDVCTILGIKKKH